jgi:predicted GNAT family acetyltransferase
MAGSLRGRRIRRPGGYDLWMTDTTDPKAAAAVDEIRVADNPELSRYEARIGEQVFGFVDYELDPATDRIVLVHTEVLPEAEGKGVGSRLAKGTLEDVRARGLKMIVDCEFIAAYLKRHPREYEDLISR